MPSRGTRRPRRAVRLQLHSPDTLAHSGRHMHPIVDRRRGRCTTCTLPRPHRTIRRRMEMRHSRPRHIFAWLPDRHGTPRAGSDVLASPRQAPPAARRERCPGPARTRRVGAASPQPCERTPCGMQRRDGRRRHARNGGPPGGLRSPSRRLARFWAVWATPRAAAPSRRCYCCPPLRCYCCSGAP